jgi:hypothetical protein
VSEVLIDSSFDFRTDAGGLDPDQHSPTLRRFHQKLWSKELPTGKRLNFRLDTPGHYLLHEDQDLFVSLASDGFVPSFRNRKRQQGLIQEVGEELTRSFQDLVYTIGGYLVFPAKRVGNQMTINAARGFNQKISDRFDLTLECIRRHYVLNKSPLEDTLNRYSSFFELFNDFEGYVEFFMLEDMVRGGTVQFALPFDDFQSSPIPKSRDEYLRYMDASMQMVSARNARLNEVAG